MSKFGILPLIIDRSAPPAQDPATPISRVSILPFSNRFLFVVCKGKVMRFARGVK